MGQETVIDGTGSLATIASVISAFCASMLIFRVQRELQMQELGEINWIPWSDWILVWATEISLLFVLVPLSMMTRSSQLILVESTACAVACVLVAGYIPAILAHYRFFLGRKRTGPRTNPEPSERVIVLLTAAVAIIVAIFMLGGFSERFFAAAQ